MFTSKGTGAIHSGCPLFPCPQPPGGEPAQTDDLEQQLDTLLSNPELLENAQAFNASYAVEHFRPAIVAEKLGYIFEQAVSQTEEILPAPANPAASPAFYGLFCWPPQWRQAATAAIMMVMGLTLLVVIDHKGTPNSVSGEGMVEEAIEEALEEVSEEIVQLIDRLDGENNKAF